MVSQLEKCWQSVCKGGGDESSTKFLSDPHDNLQSYLTVLLPNFSQVSIKLYIRLGYALLLPVFVNCVTLVW